MHLAEPARHIIQPTDQQLEPVVLLTGSASKFALEGATEALWYEVRPWNIHVSLIQPGFINSEGFQKVRYTEESALASDKLSRDYYEHYSQMNTFITRVMENSLATPETVARKVIRTMKARKPKLRVPATLDAWFFSFMRRLLPQRLYHWLLYRNLPNIKNWGIDDAGTTEPERIDPS